jgi:hypothetical protein
LMTALKLNIINSFNDLTEGKLDSDFHWLIHIYPNTYSQL